MAAMLAACGEVTAPPSHASETPATSSPSVTTSDPELVPLHSPPVLALDDVPLMCGSPLDFGVDALDGPPGAEMADHPAARSLRRLMADSPLPERSGWRLVVFNEDGALFLLPDTSEEGVSFWHAEIGPATADWQPVRWGQCTLQPAFEGIAAARWELAPGERVGPDTEAVDVSVFERACASGASPEGRIVGPAVIPLEESIIVILGTRPPPGPQTCLTGPPAIVRVELPEPLGDRQLLDGSTFPAEPRN